MSRGPTQPSRVLRKLVALGDQFHGAVVGREGEAVADGRRRRQARPVAAEVAAQVSEAFLVAVQVPAGRLREVAGRHLVVRFAGAVAAQKLGGEREAGVGRAPVLGPVPVRQTEVRIARHAPQFRFIELQKLAVPRAERRAAMGQVRPGTALTASFGPSIMTWM